MLKNQWYAVEFGEEVRDTPHKVQVMGQQLVLYRDTAGRVVAHSDICIHRGAPLSGGKVKGDCVECPYHGWQFDCEGVCRKIPGLVNEDAARERRAGEREAPDPVGQVARDARRPQARERTPERRRDRPLLDVLDGHDSSRVSMGVFGPPTTGNALN